MSRRQTYAAIALVLCAAALGACKKKKGVTCELKGYNPQDSNRVVVHVVAEKGTSITCTSAGQSCAFAVVPKSGEMDIDVYLSETSKPKKAFIEASLGGKRTEVVVDLAALPPSVQVAFGHGTISCTARDCSGKLTIAPRATLSLKAPAGTIVEIGSDKLTVDSSGSIDDARVNVALSPPLDKQPLEKVCVGLVPEVNAVFGSTTLKLTFPDKVVVSTKVELNSVFVQTDLTAALKKIATGPVLFPWEKPGTPPTKGKRGAIFLENDQCYDAGQPGATVADLDVVAIAEEQTRVGECTYQLTGEKTRKDEGTTTGKITLYDSHAAAYDRITGKSVGKKVFLAPKDCTTNFKLGSATTKVTDQTSYASEDQIAAWAVTLAK